MVGPTRAGAGPPVLLAGTPQNGKEKPGIAVARPAPQASIGSSISPTCGPCAPLLRPLPVFRPCLASEIIFLGFVALLVLFGNYYSIID